MVRMVSILNKNKNTSTGKKKVLSRGLAKRAALLHNYVLDVK